MQGLDKSEESAGPGPPERWALVAGGSGGIGSAICRALAGDGWNVAVAYHRSAERAARTAAAVEAHGAASLALAADLTDPGAAAEAVAGVAERGPLAGLVYAAGPVIRLEYVAALSPSEFAAAVDRDLKACFNFLQPGLPHLRERAGAVLALSTQAVARYAKRDALSVAPKAAVAALVRGIAAEEGRYGTRANTIGVGVIEGEGMWQALVESGGYDEATLAAARRATALRRFGRPEDVAALARFLMSPEAAWISAQTIYVDGGYSA